MIRVVYGELRGSVKSVLRLADGSRAITLDDGTSVRSRKMRQSQWQGANCHGADVKPSLTVVIRTDEKNTMGYAVRVTDQPVATIGHDGEPPVSQGKPVTISSFTVDTPGPLKGGDSLKATLRGSAGAQAAFSVPGVVDTIPMTETSPASTRARISSPATPT